MSLTSTVGAKQFWHPDRILKGWKLEGGITLSLFARTLLHACTHSLTRMHALSYTRTHSLTNTHTRSCFKIIKETNVESQAWHKPVKNYGSVTNLDLKFHTSPNFWKPFLVSRGTSSIKPSSSEFTIVILVKVMEFRYSRGSTGSTHAMQQT